MTDNPKEISKQIKEIKNKRLRFVKSTTEYTNIGSAGQPEALQDLSALSAKVMTHPSEGMERQDSDSSLGSLKDLATAMETELQEETALRRQDSDSSLGSLKDLATAMETSLEKRDSDSSLGEKKVQPEIKLADIQKTIQLYSSVNSKKKSRYYGAIGYMKKLRDKLKTDERIDIETLCDDKESSEDDKIRTAINHLFYIVETRTGHRPFRQTVSSSFSSVERTIDNQFIEEVSTSSNPNTNELNELNQWNTTVKSYRNDIPTGISGVRPLDYRIEEKYIINKIDNAENTIITPLCSSLRTLKNEFKNKNQHKDELYTKLSSKIDQLSNYKHKGYSADKVEESTKFLYITLKEHQDKINLDAKSIGNDKLSDEIERFLEYFNGIA